MCVKEKPFEAFSKNINHLVGDRLLFFIIPFLHVISLLQTENPQRKSALKGNSDGFKNKKSEILKGIKSRP